MRLPLAPSDGERLLYVDPCNRLLIVTQLVGWVGLSTALWLFASNGPWLFPFFAWVVLGIAYFTLSFAANTSFRRFDLAAHDRLVADWRAAEPPSIDVFLPSCGESLSVLENTFSHVVRLEHAGRLRILCLDDAGGLEVARLAARFGFEYLSRPNKGEFKKAGNLRYAFLRTDGDFIVVFDADFCPRPDFLVELLPYLLADASIGIAQSPQYFDTSDDKNWLENGAGAVQEFFYRWVMPSRDARRSPICVGTNAIYRRSALIETDGGALVENSEDVHTGFDLICKGYDTKYIPVVLAKGLSPHTIEAFFNQQHRWCSGSMSLLFSHKFWHQPIGLRRRLTFLAGMSYFLYTALAVVIAPLPAVLLVCLMPDQVRWQNYLLLAPALLQAFVFLPRWHRAPYGVDAMRTKLVYSWAHLFAFADRIRHRSLQWNPTGGTRDSRSARFTRVKCLLVGWPLVSLAAVIGGSAAHMHSLFDINYLLPVTSATIYASTTLLVLRRLPTAHYVSAIRDADSTPAAERPDPLVTRVAA